MPAGSSVQRPPTNDPSSVASDSGNSKRDLATWWRTFKKNSKRDEDKATPAFQTGIFGVPLDVSIKYAYVAISLFNDEGQSYIYGYVPIVVAKCGVFLKEKATEVEGIFRLAGAERRIKELMVHFNSPERYGKGLDWTGYTVHDAANLLRRYLNQLPEPIVPLNTYQQFREPLRFHQAQAVGPIEMQAETKGDFDPEATIRIYQQLITALPSLNRQLLLYILDLLAVFSSKCNINLMTAPNLAAIFQPGILRHPDHDMAPAEYRLSQDVLIFLIENQDHFIVGMEGTAVDEQTIQDVQSAAKAAASPTTPKMRNQQLLGRSASTASAGSENMRRFGDIRRNASTNSRGSRQSNNSPSPVTPPAGNPFTPGSKSSGVHRSNTVPSKKSPSPAMSASERFQPFRAPESPVAAAPIPSPLSGIANTSQARNSGENLQVHKGPYSGPRASASPQRSPLLRPFATSGRSPSQDRHLSPADGVFMEASTGSGRASPVGTPPRERGISSLWKQSPASETEKREGRRPNKLQKKRPAEGISTQSSQQSLGGSAQLASPQATTTGSADPAFLPLDARQSEPTTRDAISSSNTLQGGEEQVNESSNSTTPRMLERDASDATIRPEHFKSIQHTVEPITTPHRTDAESTTSHETGNEASETGEEGEALEIGKKEKKHHRWRISMASSKQVESNAIPQASAPLSTLGSSTNADRSNSSVTSINKSRKSFTDDSYQSSSARAPSNSDADDRATSPRRGPMKWFKGKLQDLHDKKEDRERAKSPPPRENHEAGSSQSLDAVAIAESTSPAQEPSSAIAQEATAATKSQLPRLSTEDLARAETMTDTSEVMTPRAVQQPMLPEAQPSIPAHDRGAEDLNPVTQS